MTQTKCIQEVFRPLYFFHILLCCSLMLKSIKFNLHSISDNDKAKRWFAHLSRCVPFQVMSNWICHWWTNQGVETSQCNVLSFCLVFVCIFCFLWFLFISVCQLCILSCSGTLCLCWISGRTHPESASALFGYFRVSGSFIITGFTLRFLRSFYLICIVIISHSLCRGDMAQEVELSSGSRRVAGSIPPWACRSVPEQDT